MKRSLYYRVIITYVLIALLGAVFLFTAGSYLIEKKLIEFKSREMLDIAQNISSLGISRYFSDAESKENVYESLDLTAEYTGTGICILNNSGNYIMDTDLSLDEALGKRIEGFDPASFGPEYYEISNFFGKYNTDMLNVMTPIISRMTTRGYVTVHFPLTEIYERRMQMVGTVSVIAIVIYLISFLMLIQFHFGIYRPIRKISEGAHEVAIGNLGHRIDIKTGDEIGYTAESINMMAHEIEKSSDYQKSFISNVSHDFRSPLTSIKGFTEAMIDGTIPPEMHEKYLKIISKEVERLEGLTENITKLSNMDPDQVMLNRSVFDINSVIKNTAALFEGSCRKKNITISLVLTGDVLEVDADVEKIKQVLYNLLDNAIKFSSKNSEIKIETSEKYEKCYVSVKDHGTGIKKEDLPKIWERFYKSDASRGMDQKGTGLGLAIVKEIIRAHGQNINVVSTEGVGTEFVFTLPIAEE